MRFTFRQLVYFRAAAELGSFSAAAKHLYVSPTAVAAAVSDLERVLETQLCLRRKSLGIELTAAGTYFLAEARALLSSAEELERATRSHDGTLHGPVSVGCFTTLAPTVLPALTTGFEALHPKVALSYVDGSMDELLPLLQSGRLEVLIAYSVNLPSGLDEAVLYEASPHILLSAEHRLTQQETVSLSDLTDEPLIMLDLPPTGRHTLDVLHAAGVRPNVRHRTPNFELVRSMVARNLGYSLLVQRLPIDHSYEGMRLVAKRIRPALSKETVVMVWPEEARLNDRVQALIEFASQTFGSQWMPKL